MRIRSVALGGTLLLALAAGGPLAGAKVRTTVHSRGVKPGVYAGLSSQGLPVEFRIEGPRCVTNNNPRRPESWYCVDSTSTLSTIKESCPDGSSFPTPFVALYMTELTSQNTATVFVRESSSGVTTVKSTFNITHVNTHGTATGNLNQDYRIVNPSGVAELCSSGTVAFTAKLTR